MRSIHSWLAITVIVIALGPAAGAEPKTHKAAPATKADVDRLEKRVEDQQKQIDKLVRAQQQYLQALKGIFDSPVSSNADDAKPGEPAAAPSVESPQSAAKPAPDKAAAFTDAKAAKAKVEPKPVKKKPDGAGSIVGKVTGAAEAVIYVEDIVQATSGTAQMRQEGKQFVPPVLIVQKGTSVSFPNMDAIFHNVFSLSPDNSFDLGSYPKGESKSVTMTRPGVVSVYCNMHPQMVGHILVVPNGNYARVGKDGFFKLTNVPAGHHRVVAWAPNAEPAAADAEVSDTGVVSLELELKKGHVRPHTKKDGMPYGSYAD